MKKLEALSRAGEDHIEMKKPTTVATDWPGSEKGLTADLGHEPRHLGSLC